MGPARRSTGRRVLGFSVLVVAGAAGFSACNSQGDGADLAQQACSHVVRSVHDWERSTEPGLSSATAANLRRKASSELRIALPLAAAANSDDGSWNSLMTTISEDATVDESHLVPALRAQCAVADNQINVNPQSPSGSRGNTPPTADVNPQSPAGG